MARRKMTAARGLELLGTREGTEALLDWMEGGPLPELPLMKGDRAYWKDPYNGARLEVLVREVRTNLARVTVKTYGECETLWVPIEELEGM